MKEFFKNFMAGFMATLGIIFALFLFGKIFNSLEKYFLSQNCDTYFETLKEQNLVPHRCY